MQLARLGTTHRPVCVDTEASILAACRLMREQRVQQLVVTAHREGASRAIGVVSARDIITRVVALGLDASVVTAGDIVWSAPGAARLEDGVAETMSRLCASGNEAMPVVDGNGKITGVLFLDDLLQALARSDGSRAHGFRR